ncbi:MAG: sulfite exporter TauE/SafE family protein [Phycisphaerales bacterium]|nr:sulfite exporter TauE/SafE family protein [Phycisphaerales bacterium]
MADTKSLAQRRSDGVWRARPRRWPFPLWLALFYPAWALTLWLGGWAHDALAQWPVAAAMVFGSYVAGATPMGGGTVAFPILVLLMDQPPSVGRAFAFAAQSTGMTSAVIFIVASGRPLALRLLRWTMLGSVIGVPIGLAALTPIVPALWVKLIFACLWASFGVLMFARLSEFARFEGVTPVSARFDRSLGLGVGLLGGAGVVAVTGVGIEMLVFTALLLIRRADLKIAIPTAVAGAAFASLVGLVASSALHASDPARHPLSPGVLHAWLAAAPIIVLGAPLGSFMMSVIPRTWTLLFVAALCILQFVWMGADSGLSPGGWAAAVGGVAAANVAFVGLRRAGLRFSAGESSAGAAR